jgi:hypothetical protein
MIRPSRRGFLQGLLAAPIVAPIAAREVAASMIAPGYVARMWVKYGAGPWEQVVTPMGRAHAITGQGTFCTRASLNIFPRLLDVYDTAVEPGFAEAAAE